MMGLAAPVAVVAHDAGAANIILAWLGAEGLAGCRPVMAGPAESLWKARFPAAPLLALDDALAGAATLLSGTGWASDLEHEARRRARAAGIRSVAVIDHWVNYRARFSRNGAELLPDEIWVTDPYALAEARRAIPEVPVREQPNLYLAQQAAAAGPVPADGDVLFVAEPARDDWGRGTPGEFQTLDYLAAHRHIAGIPAGALLRIRPHPSDPPGKYDPWIAAHPGSRLDASPDMAAALAGARWVAGLQSAALVIAMAAERSAICALPPHAPPCLLPHDGLVHLRALAT
jgi:hypothetical protein